MTIKSRKTAELNLLLDTGTRLNAQLLETETILYSTLAQMYNCQDLSRGCEVNPRNVTSVIYPLFLSPLLLLSCASVDQLTNRLASMPVL